MNKEQLPQRRSIRLRDYDYTENGAYFVTICTHNHDCLFGVVVEDEVCLNSCGQIVVNEWLKTAALRKTIELDCFVVMPNHFHGIIIILNEERARYITPLQNVSREFAPLASNSLSSIVGAFKASVTRQIKRLPGSPSSQIWQRNFYEHVIRDDVDLERIRTYVVENPGKWNEDSLFRKYS